MQGGCYKWVAMQPLQISGVQEDSRRSLPALSGVNLSVRLGELVCVCGEVGPLVLVAHQTIVADGIFPYALCSHL